VNSTWYAVIIGPNGALRPGGIGPGEYNDLIPCVGVTWEQSSTPLARAVLTIDPGSWTPKLATQINQLLVMRWQLREVTLYDYVSQPARVNVAFGHASQPARPSKLGCTIQLREALISNVQVRRDAFLGGAQVTIDYAIKHIVYGK
jgi:hypothetical protein